MFSTCATGNARLIRQHRVWLVLFGAARRSAAAQRREWGTLRRHREPIHTISSHRRSALRECKSTPVSRERLIPAFLSPFPDDWMRFPGSRQNRMGIIPGRQILLSASLLLVATRSEDRSEEHTS